jgi:3-oxoacyl-[acyl-carrier protein] reductase
MQKAVAIVTGASSGIGRATAIRLALDYSDVVVVARNSTELNATADQIHALGAEPLVVACDLSQSDAAEIVVNQTLNKCARIDALLNIAGAVPAKDLFEMSDAEWTASTELKLHGARRLTMHAWKALGASKGSVVLISGNSAEVPTPEAAAVGVINAAIVALAKAFADRGIHDCVQVNSVSPGAVMTERRISMIERWASAHKIEIEVAKLQLLQKAQISRYGMPDDIANLLAFLISPAGRWITGSQIRIDGGEVRAL